jgi:hypothetical protein
MTPAEVARIAEGQPDDVCACGDYRHQHEGGVGRCKLGVLCWPTPCQRFRAVESLDLTHLERTTR